MKTTACAALVVFICGGWAAGCTKTQVRTPTATPALETPPPPEPRLIIPVTIPEPPEAPRAQVTAPTTSKPREQQSAPRSERSSTPAPPPAAEPPPPAPSLQTTTNVGELEQRSRALIQQAEQNLGRVNYAALNLEGKFSFDTAKSFIRRAEENIKIKNFVFAKEAAEKAASLAANLANR